MCEVAIAIFYLIIIIFVGKSLRTGNEETEVYAEKN